MEILKVDSLAEFLSMKYVKVPLPNTNGLVRLLCLEHGQSVPPHKHPEGDEIFYVLKGKADFTVGKETVCIEVGSFTKAAAGTCHGWKNGSERLILFSVLIPPSSYELAEKAEKMEFV